MSLGLFPLLRTLGSPVRAADCKIHLATWNGTDDPLDVYTAGMFDAWQSEQTLPNFNRPYVVTLIAMPERHRWLFVGVFAVDGEPVVDQMGHFRYVMREQGETHEVSGRLVVAFERPGRQSYLNAERWETGIVVTALRPERYQIAEFEGYAKVRIGFDTLSAIVNQQLPSWRSALSSVGGVYVISDHVTGKLYVGSATGEGGFWGRWSGYVATGHGGNVRLRELGMALGASASSLHFSILETADTRTSEAEVVKREQFWKAVLLSRTHGFNAN